MEWLIGENDGKEWINVRSNTMVTVEHAGDTVEAEAIKLVLLHPESKVTQEEAQHFMAAIVEQPTVPQLMATLDTLMEIEVVGPIEHVNSIQHVLRSMAVHDVQQNHQAQAVGSVDELLEVLGGSVATAGGEEVVHLVAETGIVSMLHDGHELDSIVAQVLDARQHVLCELLVGRDSRLGR